MAGRWANLQFETLFVSCISECRKTRLYGDFSIYLGPPGSNLLMESYSLGNNSIQTVYQGFQVLVSLNIMKDEMPELKMVSISFAIFKPTEDAYNVIMLDVCKPTCIISVTKHCHQSGFPNICHIMLQAPEGQHPVIYIPQFEDKEYDEGLCEYYGMSIGQNPLIHSVNLNRNLHYVMENVTFCFWKEQATNKFIATASSVTITLYSYVNSTLNLFHVEIPVSITTCLGCLISNAAQLISDSKYLWVENMSLRKYLLFELEMDFPCSRTADTFYYSNVDFHMDFVKGVYYNSGYTIYFKNALLCGVKTTSVYYLYLFYVPQTCATFQHIPTTSSFYEIGRHVQIEIFVHSLFMCVACSSPKKLGIGFLQPILDVRHPVLDNSCNYISTSAVENHTPAVKSVPERYLFISFDTPCSHSFIIESTDPCNVLGQLRLKISEHEIDSIAGIWSTLFYELLKTNLVTCPNLTIPGDQFTYLAKNKPIASLRITIQQHNSSFQHLMSNEVAVYHLRKQSKTSKILGVKYKYNVLPQHFKPVQLQFGAISGGKDYIVIFVTRKSNDINQMKGQSVNFKIIFLKQLSVKHTREVNNREFKAYTNISWQEGNKKCLQKGDDGLFAFPGYAHLTKSLTAISKGFFDLHIPIFIGAKGIQNVSRNSISISNICI